MKPCHKCKSEKLKVWNCGYSSFNVSGVTCLSCNFKMETSCDTDKGVIKAWNRLKQVDVDFMIWKGKHKDCQIYGNADIAEAAWKAAYKKYHKGKGA